MAYLRDIALACRYAGCKSRAVVELYNHVNACLGQYCRKHGQARLREIKHSERELNRNEP